MSAGMVIFTIFIAVVIITVVWIILYLIYNEIKRKGMPTLPYKKSLFGVTSVKTKK
jgi:lipid-A-disaccharide synthase-like uncharacterized protein